MGHGNFNKHAVPYLNDQCEGLANTVTGTHTAILLTIGSNLKSMVYESKANSTKYSASIFDAERSTNNRPAKEENISFLKNR
jgi:hypothetical protein